MLFLKILLIKLVCCKYDENLLLTRLLDGFRLEFFKSTDCPLSEELGRTLFEMDPLNVQAVPDSCVRYVQDGFAKYNPMVRPVANFSTALDVGMELTLLQIIELNERDQYLMTSMMYSFNWTDTYLTWRPSMNGGVDKIVISPGKIWTPDILLYQSIQDGFDSKFPSNIECYSDGSCSWLPPAIVQSSCEVDMTFFPFDTQECVMKFGSWSYTKNYLNIMINNPNNAVVGGGQKGEILIDPAQYIKSTEWEIVGKECMLSETLYECCPNYYQDITYKLKLKRYVFYPTLTLVLPCVMTAMLIVLTFILPPDAGEKVGLNITILLAMVVFMDQLSQQTPPMPSSLPVIGQFFVASMIIIAASMFSTIFCLKLHHTQGREARQMPKWVRFMLLDIMPIVLFIHPPPDRPLDLDEENSKQDLIEFTGNSELYFIYKELKFISDRMREQDNDGSYEDEWKYAALVLDRACAWLFLGGLSISFLATICSAPGIFYSIESH